MAKVILFKRKVVTHINASGDVRPLVYEASSPIQTIRFRFEETDYNPSEIENGGTWTKVTDSSFNDWDWYCEDTNWKEKFSMSFTEDNKVSIVYVNDNNVTNGEYMFYDCAGLTSISENSFNNIIDSSYMFLSCRSLTSIGNNSFNSVLNGSGMFLSCRNLASISENNFNNVINGDTMFYNCSSLTSIPANSFNNVINGKHMFHNCSSLTSIPANSFNNVDDGSFMFYDCTSLVSIGNNSFNKVTNSENMFYGCIGLTIIPENSFNSVIITRNMFSSCTCLTIIPENSFNNVTDCSYMFYDCTNVEHGALALYNKWIASGKVISHNYTFTHCGKDTTTGLAELRQIPRSWGGLADDTTDKLIIDGKEYRTVTIGNQTWMAQNLDLETDSGSIVSNRRSDNEDYGRLYQWDKAVEVANSIEGWHLPTRAEWDELYNFVGKDSTHLKSKTEWDDEGKGTDDYGFSILPAGLYRGGDYYLVSINACFCTSEEDDYDSSRAYGKDFSKLTTMDGYDYNKTNYRSVRLIKDN